MRILLVNDLETAMSGGDVHVSLKRKLLAERGHEVSLLTCSHKFGGVISYLSRIFNLKDYFRMKRMIATFNPDVIHIHGIRSCLSLSPAVAAKKKRVPVVVTLHDFHYVCPKIWMIHENGDVCPYGFGIRCLFLKCPPRKFFLHDWGKWFKVWLHRKLLGYSVDAYIAPSEELAEWTSRSLGVDVEVIPNFKYVSVDRVWDLPENNVILCVSRLAGEKGIDYLIRAMPLICQEIPDAKLIISGDGADRKRLQEIVNHLGLGERVKFTGWVDHDRIGELYRMARVVAIPSVWAESFGSVAMEAFTYGRPVVASRIGGMAKVVVDGKYGYLVEPGDVDDLAGKVTSILGDPGLAIEMGKQASSYSRSFSWEAHAQKLEDLLFRVTGQNSS